jgi:deoxyhypusine synthase
LVGELQLKYVEQMTLTGKMTVNQLITQMGACGVLGAGRIARAVSIMVDMFRDPSYTVFLTLAGPMIPGGLRRIIGTLVDQEYVQALVMSGANIVHDVVEALGYKGVQGSVRVDDLILREQNIGRAGDIYFEQDGFTALEQEIHRILDQINEQHSQRISVSRLLHFIGQSLRDEDSVLRRAAKHGIPVFAPGIVDSMVGLHLWTYNQLKQMEVDSIIDLDHLSTMVLDAERVGVIVLGGGVPKHFVFGANTLREGVDAAVQITLDRPEGGSFSGAPLAESISWKKVRTRNKLATVIGDATILFPVIVAAVLEIFEQDQERRVH